LPENNAIIIPATGTPSMIAKLLLQNTGFVAVMGALLFVSAGTLHWPGAWTFLAISVVLGPAFGFWLARTDPALLAERMRLTARDEQPPADKKFMLAIVATVVTWFVVMGIDRRVHPSEASFALQTLGVAMYLLSMVCIMWVFRENSFAAPLVKVQAERGQSYAGNWVMTV
jgi:protein-S-isoprenylcysteine O-methyltransferase Ste14